MKKLFLFLFLFVGVISAQNYVTIYDSVASNSGSRTSYIYLPSSSVFKVDSIGLQIIYEGEIDVDKLIVTKGTRDGDGTFVAIATPDSTTITVNNAAATNTAESYTPTSLSLIDLRNIDWIRVVVQPASSGNDATDPNRLWVKAFRYQHKF